MNARIDLLAVVALGTATCATTSQAEQKQVGTPAQFAIKQRVDVNDGSVRCVAFAPDGSSLAACGDRFVHLFDLKTGARIHRLEGHQDEVSSVAFSPSGKQLASGSRDKTIRIWHVDSGKIAKVLETNDGPQPPGPIGRVVFFPNGKVLASCSTTSQYVTLWDVEANSWEHMVRTTHLGEGCTCMAIAPDGKHCVVSGARNRRDFAGQVSFYKVNSGLQLLWHRDHDGEMLATYVAFDANGMEFLSCGHDNAVRIWEVKTGRLSQKLSGPEGNSVMQAALFTPDGSRVVGVTREGALQLWAVGDGRLLASASASDKGVGVLDLALSPDGSTAATCGEDHAIQLWGLPPPKTAK